MLGVSTWAPEDLAFYHDIFFPEYLMLHNIFEISFINGVLKLLSSSKIESGGQRDMSPLLS